MEVTKREERAQEERLRLKRKFKLSAFPCPPNCRKLVHRWRDRQRVPDVRTL